MNKEMHFPSLDGSISVLSGFPFPSVQFTTAAGKPLIRIRDLHSHLTETNFVGEFDPVFLVQRDDILIGMDGDFSVVRWKGPEALLNQRVCKVSVTGSKISDRFLYWWLQPHISAIHRRTPQTTVRHLSVGDIYRITQPPIARSQQTIAAAILDTVDEAIAKTEAVITKLKQVSAGLLHDLLIRGLDENGQLRDPITCHSEQFRDSPLGSIPCQWELRPLRECLLRSPQNGIYKPAGAIGQGTILIGQTSITEDRSIDLALARRAEISPEERDRYGLRKGDILMSRVFATLEGIGQPAFVPSLPEPAVFESNMMCLRVNPEIIASSLLFHWLMSARLRHKVVSCVNLSNQASINQQCLNSLPVAIPATSEQQRILNAIRIQYHSVEAQSIQLRKLQQLKSGLMADLLTGRVRMPEGVVAS